jgi:hypothetical protein
METVDIPLSSTQDDQLRPNVIVKDWDSSINISKSTEEALTSIATNNATCEFCDKEFASERGKKTHYHACKVREASKANDSTLGNNVRHTVPTSHKSHKSAAESHIPSRTTTNAESDQVLVPSACNIP